MSATWEEIAARRAEMRHWYWYGIPTFFKCPWNEDPKACDIALVGIPHSTGNGSTERDQHLGPRSVRHVSGRLRRAHQGFQLVPWEACRIHDVGDVPLPEANFFSLAITIQQQAGGNLSEALGNLSKVLRERSRMAGKVKAR